MIIKHKHGRLESLPRQDLPRNPNSSLEVSHAYFFASIGKHVSNHKPMFIYQESKIKQISK
jgi:hypothetical protein